MNLAQTIALSPLWKPVMNTPKGSIRKRIGPSLKEGYGLEGAAGQSHHRLHWRVLLEAAEEEAVVLAAFPIDLLQPEPRVFCFLIPCSETAKAAM